VVMCSKVYYEYRELFSANELLGDNHCRHLEPLEKKKWKFGMLSSPVYLNVTIPKPSHSSDSLYYSHEQFHTNS
ncbi:hypothetical protein SK128_004200, partial [Halocaridina rubra]